MAKRDVKSGDGSSVLWFFCRRTSLNERMDVGSRVCSLRVMTAEYGSGSCQITSSWSGSGWTFEEDEKSLYPVAVEKKDDGPEVEGVFSVAGVCGKDSFRAVERLTSSW